MATDGRRAVPDVAGFFACSDGTIIGPRGKRVGGYVDRDGYRWSPVSQDGVRRNVSHHSMIAAAFLGPRPEGYDIDHINGDRGDNRAENLRYTTHAENMAGSVQPPSATAKLTEEQAGAALRLLGREPHAVIAERFNVPVSVIWNLSAGRTWRRLQGVSPEADRTQGNQAHDPS